MATKKKNYYLALVDFDTEIILICINSHFEVLFHSQSNSS